VRINDRLIPGLRLQLDALAVAQLSNVCEIGRYQVQHVVHFPRTRHPRLVDQCESNALLPQQINKSLVKLSLVRNLQREFEISGKFLQERFEPRDKFRTRLEHGIVEGAELEKKWSELVADHAHCFQEMVQIFVAILADFVVSDYLRDLRGKYEARGSFQVPAFDS
jgi:hypothetical protein